MLTGQVGIISGKTGFWAPIIQVITNSHYNHAVVAINETECVSAEPGGAIIRPISYYNTNNSIVWSHLDLHNKHQLVANKARALVGTPYSWVDFVYAGLGAVLKEHTPQWIANRAANPHALICSQLCDLALQAGGIHLFKDERPPGGVTPGTFGRYYKRHGWTEDA